MLTFSKVEVETAMVSETDTGEVESDIVKEEREKERWKREEEGAAVGNFFFFFFSLDLGIDKL